MEEAEKEAMSYATTFGDQDITQPPSSFEAFKEEKAPVAERRLKRKTKADIARRMQICLYQKVIT